MAHLSEENMTRAQAIVALYPKRRSALIPLCHLAQGQDGYLTEEAMDDIAELCGVTAAEVHGTASFYDMLHLEPVGRYVMAICTNIACMLAGSYELLEHAQEHLQTGIGHTSADSMFTIEEAECLAGCDTAPCVQVNHRFFGPLDNDSFDRLIEELRSGTHDDAVPQHGVLCRIERTVALLNNTSDSASSDRLTS